VIELAAYLAFRLGVGLVGALPGRVATALGEAGGRLWYLLAPDRRRTTARHARRLGAAPGSEKGLVRRIFSGYGRYWAEAFWIRPRRRREIHASLEVEGIEWVRAAKAAGRGQIVALPHVGNWEVAGLIAEQEGVLLVAVAENLRNRRMRDWFVRLRNQLGIGIVLSGTKGTMKELEEVIRGNGMVALLCDRDLRGRGVPVCFFGEETTLPAGPVTLALRTGAPVLPVAAYFRPNGGHRIVVHPPLELPEGHRPEDIREGTQRLAEALEAMIREAPEQWHLLQPNWPSDRVPLP
jgi:KDO2-lipid IV(A) lauroyltransferase